MEKVLVRFADDKGKTRESVFETESVSELKQALLERGFFIISEQIIEKSLSEKILAVFPFGRGVSYSELTEFTKLLRTLLKAGLPLKDSLDVLLDEVSTGGLNRALLQVQGDIEEGISFSRALARHPGIFPEIYVKTVIAGERSGALESVLDRLGSHFSNIIAVRRKITAALIYPAVLLVVCMVAVIYLLIWVMPDFAELFHSLDVSLPIYTQFVLWLSSFLGRWLPAFVFATGIGIFFFVKFAGTSAGRLSIDRFKLRIPLVGNLEEKFAYSQFARTLSTLVNGGIPLVESLGVVLESLENKALAEKLERLPRDIERGDGFAKALRSIPGIPAMMPKVIHVGEESGNLGEMLSNLADYYDEEISTLTGTLTALIEPMLFLFMASVVGSMVISLLVPMLTAASNIR